MKILFFILIPFLLFAQPELMILMDNGISYDTDAKTYFNAMITPLTMEQKTRINTFVKMLKDSLAITNLSETFDLLYIYANETEDAALKNLVQREFDGTAYASPIFTQWEGFTGDGVSTYIDIGYNPVSDASTLSINSCHISAYVRSGTGAGQNWVIGSYIDVNTANCRLAIKAVGSYFVADVWNQGDDRLLADISALSLPAFWCYSRTAVDLATGYRNVTPIGTNTNTLTGSIPDMTFYILAVHFTTIPPYATDFDDKQISFISVGKGLTAIEERKLNNCVEWYMDDLGTGVQ